MPNATQIEHPYYLPIDSVSAAQLRVALTDPVTLSPMRSPAVLTDCGHSFEQSTIDALQRKTSGARSCPLCRTPIIATPKPNYLAQSMIDAMWPPPAYPQTHRPGSVALPQRLANAERFAIHLGCGPQVVPNGSSYITHAAVASLAMACLYVGLCAHASPQGSDKVALGLAVSCMMRLGYAHESARIVCLVGLLIFSSAHLLAGPLALAHRAIDTDRAPTNLPAPTFMQIIFAFKELDDDIRKLRGRT